MIKVENGDILESTAKCLVNTVNCEGFMGKGIAYQFKQHFPLNNKNYVSACKSGMLKIGKVLLYEEDDIVIANFPTKDKWREKSKYEYIELGLKDLIEQIKIRNIESIAIPPLGCGNGGLNWNKVKQMIIDCFEKIDIDIFIYEPTSNFNIKKDSEIPKMSASHLILMKLKGKLDKFNRLRLQKAAFFMNIFSNEDYFRFEEYKYGPYAHSIDILSRTIKEFQDCYNVNTNKAEEILYNNLISDSVKETVNKYNYSILQSTNFLNSIASDHELEVASTIVAIVKKHPSITDSSIVDLFFEWPKYDKSRFSSEEILNITHYLVQSKILSKELIGYNISDEINNGCKVFYRFKK